MFYALVAILVIAVGLNAVFEGGEAGNDVAYVILALPVTAIYFYPSIIAYIRENRYKKPILMLNTIFGWNYDRMGCRIGLGILAR